MTKLWEKLIETKRIFTGRLLSLRVDKVEMPDGKSSTREVVEHPGAVAVVAITKNNELVLVRQFRTATGEVVLEIPAGVPGKEEPGEVAAARELEEETGYRPGKVAKIYEGFASPGYSSEVLRYYLATDLQKTNQNTDEDEFVEVDHLPVSQCLKMLAAGEIKDNKTIVGILIADKFLKGEL
jgi:ADP-ribose pyrophosphatase